jgi:hypothetical protein
VASVDHGAVHHAHGNGRHVVDRNSNHDLIEKYRSFRGLSSPSTHKSEGEPAEHIEVRIVELLRECRGLESGSRPGVDVALTKVISRG